MKVRLSRIKKRENSTLQPGGSWDWEDFDVILKDNCSVVAPSIFLKVSQSRNMAMFNYARIDDFERYYYIRDWEWIDRQWCAHLEVDVLASWKAQIGQYTAYVTRSAAQYDGDIVDMMYPAQAERTVSVGNGFGWDSWRSSFDAGYFVLGIIGKNNAQNGGGVTYYKATPNQMKALSNYMLNENAPMYGDISDISKDLWKTIFNPLQYIVSCMWFPTQPIQKNGDLYVGWWEVQGISIEPLASLTWGYTSGSGFIIPKHPQATTRGNYLNMPPFSRYHLYAGPWGIIPIDNAVLLNKTSLNVEWKVDYVTGSGRLRIKDGSAIISEHFTQVGVPVALGQNLINQGALASVVSAPMNTVGSLISGDVSGMLSNATTGVMSAAQLMQSIPSTMGSNGSFTYSTEFKLVGEFFNLVGEDLASRGRPLCQPKQLSSLSGYVLCSDADPAIDCTHAELEKIVSYLNSGFYME